MPALSANQTIPAHAQVASLSAQATFTASRQVAAPAQVATLWMEDFPDVHFTAARHVPQAAQRARLRLSPLPAEPRPPGVPATPRPHAMLDGSFHLDGSLLA